MLKYDNNVAKSFDIPAINLNVLVQQNYFLIYLAVFLDISVKPFSPCINCITYVWKTILFTQSEMILVTNRI